jgi:hypothetical protein
MSTLPYDNSPITDRRSERRSDRVAVVAAHLIPLVLLPSGIWRILLGCGVSMGFDRATLEEQGFPGHGTVMVVCLTLLTEALALLSLGLVRPWGEAVPNWVPRLRGRRIPRGPVVVVAATGGLLLTAIWAFALRGVFTGGLEEVHGRGWHALVVACYTPAILWGPLLLLVTFLYYVRRSRATSPQPLETDEAARARAA